MKKQTHKLLAVLLAAIMILSAAPAVTFTASAETEGIFTYSIYNGEAMVTGLTDKSYSGELNIPSTLGGYPVTSIGRRAFEGFRGLTSITISDSVVSIGEDAFRNCSRLAELKIGKSLESILAMGYYPPFSGCTMLKSITVDSDNQFFHSNGNCLIETKSSTLILGCKTSIIPTNGSVVSIGSFAFSHCIDLSAIVIPNSVISIGWGSFMKCEGLTSIAIPDSVTEIVGSAFAYCSELTSVTIPDSVASIGNNAFSYCTGLTSVTIGNSVTSIGENAFYYCTGLTSITIPDSVTLIGDSAFGMTAWYNNQPDGLVYAGKVAYKYNGISANVAIKDGTVGIAANAFSYCSGLTSITIPDSVTSIGHGAFEYCTHLKDIYYTGTEEKELKIIIEDFNDHLLHATWHYNYVPSYKPGDINNDDKVNNKDLTRLFQYLSKWKVEVKEAALDINGDGKVNNKDLTRLFQYLSKWDVEIF